jgi:hypothetical protein
MNKQELIDNLNHVAYQTVLEKMHGNTGLIESVTNYIFLNRDFDYIEDVCENNVYLSVSVNRSSIDLELSIGLTPDNHESVNQVTIELIKGYIWNEIKERKRTAKEIQSTEDSLNITER